MENVETCTVDMTSQWSVWRIDDNGNVYLVREQLTEANARQIAAEFEARGHKQMYWVAEDHVAQSFHD